MSFLHALRHPSHALHTAGHALESAEHGVGHALSGAVRARNRLADKESGFIRRAESWRAGQMHHAEDLVDHASHGLARHVDGVPVAGGLARAGADGFSIGAQMWGGFSGGSFGMAEGMLNMGTHPVDTVNGLAAMSKHTLGTGSIIRGGEDALDLARGKASVGDVIARDNPIAQARDDVRFWRPVQDRMLDPYKQSCREGRYGEAAGRALFDLGSLRAPVGELTGAGWMAESAADVTPAVAAENEVQQDERGH